MTITIACPQCGAKLKAPDALAGKRTKCPKCKAGISVPAEGNWHLKTADDTDYGAVSKAELNQWFAEGLITAECHLLREGSDQWQWASEVYPALDPDAAANAPAPKPKPKAPAKATAKSPAAPAKTKSPAPAPAALQPLAPISDIFASLPPVTPLAGPPGFPAAGQASPFGGAAPYAAPNPYASYGATGSNPYASPTMAAYGGAAYGGGQSSGGLPVMGWIAAVMNFGMAIWSLVNVIAAFIKGVPYLVNGASLPPPPEYANIPAFRNQWGGPAAIGYGAGAVGGGIIVLIFTLLFVWAGTALLLGKKGAIVTNYILGGFACVWFALGALAFLLTFVPMVAVAAAVNLVYAITVIVSVSIKDVRRALH